MYSRIARLTGTPLTILQLDREVSTRQTRVHQPPLRQARPQRVWGSGSPRQRARRTGGRNEHGGRGSHLWGGMRWTAAPSWRPARAQAAARLRPVRRPAAGRTAGSPTLAPTLRTRWPLRTDSDSRDSARGPQSTGVPKVFLRIAWKSILFEQKCRLKLSRYFETNRFHPV